MMSSERAYPAPNVSSPNHQSLLLDRASSRPAPFGYIPAELVVEIFEICVQDAWDGHGVVGTRDVISHDSDSDSDPDSDAPYDLQRLPKEYGWFNVLSVCRTWHELALRSSTLWTRIIINNPISVGIMLRRSAQVGIHVKNGSFLPKEDSLSLILEQVHRLRTAKLRLSPSMPIGMVFSLARGDADILELLEFVLVSPEGVPEASFPDIQIPRLRTLSMVFGDILPLVPPLARSSSLRHLSLRGLDPSGSKGLSALLEILRSHPSLEELRIRTVLGGGTRSFQDMQWLDGDSVIDLPNLKHMSIDEADFEGPFGLFRSVSIPEATLELVCGRRWPVVREDRFKDFAVYLERVLRCGLAAKSPMALSIIHASTQSRLCINLRRLRESDVESKEPPVLDLNLGPMPSNIAFQFLRRILPHTVRAMYIKCSDLETQSWWSVFGRLDEVEELHVVEYPKSYFSDALHPSREAHRSLLFPTLRKLTLEEGYFDLDDYSDRLSDALSARHSAGAPKLELLRLVNPRGPEGVRSSQLSSLTPYAVSTIEQMDTTLESEE